MRDEPPVIEDPEDGAQFDGAQFIELMREAQLLGFHYTGRDIAELEALVGLAKAERGTNHPVACYGLSYEPTDRRCRICQLRGPCSDLDKRPRVEVMDPSQLESVICEACGQGELRVELRAPDSIIVRDYGCNTPGCLNTLGIQCGWSEETKRLPENIAFEAKPKEKLEGVLPSPKPPEPEPEPMPPYKKTRVVVKAAAPAAPEATAEEKAPEPTTARPKLRIVRPVVQKAPEPEKPAPKPEAKPKAEAKAKPEVKPRAKAKKANRVELPPYSKPIRFRFEGMFYTNLTAIACYVTASRNWSGGKFFGCDPKELKPGDALKRVWRGKRITVEVVED